MAYHAWPQRLPGGFVGVDVLFVLSGYLITSALHRRPSLADYYRARGRRLIPMAFFVALAALVAVFIVASPTAWEEAARQAVASVGYFQNWYLWAQARDYTAASTSASVFQHYWSLAVEVQLFVLWPLIALVGRRLPGRHATVAAFAVVTGLSLAWAVTDALLRGDGYFSTLDRAWEFGAGALLAFVPVLRAPVGIRVVGAVVGWMTLAASALLVHETAGHAGTTALVVVAATALVLVLGPLRAYTIPGVRKLADWSYALYLWHWPVLVLAISLARSRPVWLVLLAVVISVLLAWATTRWVGDRFWGPRARTTTPRGWIRFASVTAAGVLVVAGVQLGLVYGGRAAAAASNAAVTESPCFGAGSLSMTGCPAVPPPTAAQLEFAQADWGPVATEGSNLTCNDVPDAVGTGLARTCVGGVTASDTTLLIIGDSHSVQWAGPLLTIANQEGWRLVTEHHGGCPAIDLDYLPVDTPPLNSECRAWARTAIAAAAADPHVRYIVTSAYYSAYVSYAIDAGVPTNADPGLHDALESTMSTWVTAGKHVVLLDDTPTPPDTATECLAQAAMPSDCDYPMSGADRDSITPGVAADFAGNPLVTEINPDPWFCRADGICPEWVGGVVPFVDADHISASYATSLTAPLRAKLAAAGWFDGSTAP